MEKSIIVSKNKRRTIKIRQKFIHNKFLYTSVYLYTLHKKVDKSGEIHISYPHFHIVF